MTLNFETVRARSVSRIVDVKQPPVETSICAAYDQDAKHWRLDDTMPTERLAMDMRALDGRSPAFLKHLLLQEHLRNARTEKDQNIVRMTNRWAQKVIDAAALAREQSASSHVFWDSKGKWHSQPATARNRTYRDAGSRDRSPTRAGNEPGHDSDQDGLADAQTPHRVTSAKTSGLDDGSDERLGQMRGLLELMARKKMRLLEMQAKADTEKKTLEGMKQNISKLLSAHDMLAGSARMKTGRLKADKRRLDACLRQQRDTLNVLSCCRSNSQIKEISAGWRWSHQRAACDACRADVHKVVIQHSKAELLRARVLDEERKLVMTKKALANVGTAVKRALDEAIYKPITFTSQSATEDCGHGIVFTVSATEHPIVITGIRCARHPWSRASHQNITTLVSPCHAREQSLESKIDLTTWFLAGQTGANPKAHTSCLPCVGIFDSEPLYGDVPLQHPFVIEAGAHRSIAIHTDDKMGLLYRHERQLKVGGRSDSARGLEIKVGVVLDSHIKVAKAKDPKSACFVGQLIYRRVPRVDGSPENP